MIKGARITVVDDDQVTLKLIESSLSRLGYVCQPISDSRKALELAKMDHPDLFLLDLMMPYLNGVELCQLLKKDEALKDIPVIFLTAREETEQKISAFHAGAVDYLTKPINIPELTLRINTHLELFLARRQIENYAKNMEKLAEERAKQLCHADRLALLGTLSAGLAHEVNNPTTFISVNVQTLEKFWELIGKALAQVIKDDSRNREELGFIIEEMPRLIDSMKEGVIRIKKIVDGLLAFARKGETKSDRIVLADCVHAAQEFCQKVLNNKIKIEKKINDPSLEISGDNQQMQQVLVNLIVNSADAAEAKADAAVMIEVFRDAGKAHIRLLDNGPGVPENILNKIWDPFFTTKKPGKGTGLGLSIVRSIIESHSGRIEGSNRKEGGFVVDIILPLYSPQA